MRSPWRWMVLLGAWGVLGIGAFAAPFTRMSVFHFVVGLSAVAAWPAAFALNPLNRAVAALLLLLGAVVTLAADGPVEVGVLVGLAAVTLFLMSIQPLTARSAPLSGSDDSC